MTTRDEIVRHFLDTPKVDPAATVTYAVGPWADDVQLDWSAFREGIAMQWWANRLEWLLLNYQGDDPTVAEIRAAIQPRPANEAKAMLTREQMEEEARTLFEAAPVHI